MSEDLLAIWERVGDKLIEYGMAVLGAILILILGRIMARVGTRLAKRAMERANVDETIRSFVGRIIYIVVIAFAVIAALAKFGIQTTSFVALLGAAGLAVGLALQGSLSNFASGVMIIAFRPFSVGDFIDAAGVKGTVKEIRIFTTVMATPDNVKVILPNSRIFGDVIHNFSIFDTRRIDLTIGIGYSDDIGRAVEVLQEVMKADSRVIADPEPQVVVTELADSSVNLLARCWTARTDFFNTKCDLTRSIKESLDVQGIEIPFPQRVIHHANAQSS